MGWRAGRWWTACCGWLGQLLCSAGALFSAPVALLEQHAEPPGSGFCRAVVVHEGVDDLGVGGFADSLTTGHAGGRLACGEGIQM